MIELADAAAHVFVDDLDLPVLDRDDVHHLGRVLRLRTGERVSTSDGRGAWRWCRWSNGELQVDGEVSTVTRTTVTGIAVSLIKGDRLDWVVDRKSTRLNSSH